METLPDPSYRFDDLTASLNQADAMLTVVMSIDLTELKPETMLNYLWAVSTIINTAKNICVELFNKKAILVA